MFKYLNSWRESANKDIPDMYAKDDEVPNNQVVQTDVHQTEGSHQTPSKAEY